MDEIFADITELIRTRRTTGSTMGHNAVSAASLSDFTPDDERRAIPEGRAENPAAFTGHVYAPGSGGTLLEAQTGLEISLHGGGDDGRDIVNATPHNGKEQSGATPAGSPLSEEGLGNVKIAGCDKTVDGDDNVAFAGRGRVLSRSPLAGVGNQRIGECRCGCVERLAVASAFAERVRNGLRDGVTNQVVVVN